MKTPRQIEHDPDEMPRDLSGNGIYWAFAGMLAFFWIGTLLLIPIDWHSLALGLMTGGFVVPVILWYTENKVPRWMRR